MKPGERKLGAKARKAESKVQKERLLAKELEDATWEETDKLVRAKLQRAAEKEQKAADELARRAARKQLEEEEVKHIISNKAGVETVQKVSRAVIAQRLADKALEKMKQRAAAAEAEKQITFEPVTTNINHTRRSEAYDAAISGDVSICASSIDEALSIMSMDSGDVSKRVNKRQLYAEFYSRMEAEIRSQEPATRLSQIQDRIHKMWSRSMENPDNASR